MIENVVVASFPNFRNTNFEGSRMLSFGRGSGVSFRAGAESVSQCKADTTIAFLSLFPRSRITEMKEHIGYL